MAVYLYYLIKSNRIGSYYFTYIHLTLFNGTMIGRTFFSFIRNDQLFFLSISLQYFFARWEVFVDYNWSRQIGNEQEELTNWKASILEWEVFCLESSSFYEITGNNSYSNQSQISKNRRPMGTFNFWNQRNYLHIWIQIVLWMSSMTGKLSVVLKDTQFLRFSSGELSAVDHAVSFQL